MVGQERGGVDFEQIGRKTLDADHGVSAITRCEILPDTSLKIEERCNGPAIERLKFGSFDQLAETAFAFGLEPKLVEVSAVIPLNIPQVSIVTIADAVFGPIGLKPEHLHAAILLRQRLRLARIASAPHIASAARGGPLPADGGGAVSGTGSVPCIHRAVIHLGMVHPGMICRLLCGTTFCGRAIIHRSMIHFAMTHCIMVHRTVIYRRRVGSSGGVGSGWCTLPFRHRMAHSAMTLCLFFAIGF